MQARKLITQHFFCLLFFETHGIASVARLQREEMSTTKQEARGHGTFPAGIYESWHPLSNFANDFDQANHRAKVHKSTGSTASFKIHGNLITFKTKWSIDNGAPFDYVPFPTLAIPFPTLAMASEIDGNGILVRVPPLGLGFLMITPSCCEGKWNQWQWHFCLMWSCSWCPHSHHLFLYQWCSGCWSTVAFLLITPSLCKSAAVAICMWSHHEALLFLHSGSKN